MLTAKALRAILVSREYKRELEEMSSYLASIKQERPIIYSLAKRLWKDRRVFQLEAKRRDLVVYDGADETRVEFKYHFDCDMTKLDDELRSYGNKPIKTVLDEAQARMSSTGWTVALKVYEDMYEKKPDIFVWVICSRDLSKVGKEVLKHICWSAEQCKWIGRYPNARMDQAYMSVADSFLAKLKTVGKRPFEVLKADLATKGEFPSAYHFRICDFTKTT
jgi:hypothetical protein